MKSRSKLEKIAKELNAQEKPVIVVYEEALGVLRVNGEALSMDELNAKYPDDQFQRIIVEYVRIPYEIKN